MRFIIKDAWYTMVNDSDVAGMFIKSLILKEIWKELEKKIISHISRARILFAAHTERAQTRESAHRCDRGSNTKSYQNTSGRVRVSAERVIKKAHRQSETSRAFRFAAMFSFPRRTLSLTCTAVISFLFSHLAEINRAYNKVSRRRNGEVPSRGKRIAAGQAARLSQRTRELRERTSGLG